MTNYQRTEQWLIACGKTRTPENLSVAIGVQIEEFCELLACLRTDSEGYAKLLERTRLDLEWFAGKLKRREQEVYIPIHLRVDALDALCDIEVTGNGAAFFAGFNKDAADQAVMDSNDSKLEDGKAVFVEGTTKIGKGKDYKAPNLRGVRMSKADRPEYMRNYYEANKERMKEHRKPKPRTEAAKRAEERYREKKRILKEIAAMQHGPVGAAHD